MRPRNYALYCVESHHRARFKRKAGNRPQSPSSFVAKATLLSVVSKQRKRSFKGPNPAFRRLCFLLFKKWNWQVGQSASSLFSGGNSNYR